MLTLDADLGPPAFAVVDGRWSSWRLFVLIMGDGSLVALGLPLFLCPVSSSFVPRGGDPGGIERPSFRSRGKAVFEGLGQACVVTCLMRQGRTRCLLETRLYSG